MFAETVFLASVALFTQGGRAVPSGSHYGAAGYGGAGYGASSYGAGYGAGYGAAGYGMGYGASYGGPKYHGPQAIPVVLPDGHIADTHEVAAAKSAHFAAVSKTAAHSGYGGYDDGSYKGYAGSGYGAGYGGIYGGSGHAGGYAGAGYAKGYGGAGYAAGYHGPLAKPIVLPSGYLADTHDVVASKRAHLTSVAHAALSHSGWAPHGSYGYY